ncbi:MAG: DUF4381 family protein [candidate division Zixibacteria bacterium]|nr:DUF4381 family protein [candidate division Zixibacteria bacterium]
MMKIKNEFLIILIVMFLLSALISAQDNIGISAEVTSAEMAFEAKDTLVITLAWTGEPYLYSIDDFPIPALEKFQILGSSSMVSSQKDSSVTGGVVATRKFTYVLEPTDYGIGHIKPLSLSATNKVTGESFPLQTGQISISIAKPIPPKEKSSLKWIIVIITIAGHAIGLIVWLFIRKRKRRNTPAENPRRQYLDALEAVKKETVADRKRFFSRLYRVLIQYLENEQGLELSGKTGQEVIVVLQSIQDDHIKASFMAWLERLQQEKYRPDMPGVGEVEDMYKTVYTFFEKNISK